MAAPLLELAAVRASHARLHDTLTSVDESTVRRASLLPGWSVAHVLTHLARQADSVVRRLRGAAAGQLVEQYEGGYAGRAAAISDGSRRSAADIVADLIASDEALDALFPTLPEVVWSRDVLAVSGAVVPASRMGFSRWREVEVHHVDLGLAYTVDDWPSEFVVAALAPELERLLERADRAELLAWLIGRREAAPQLTAWD
jgi:maleylpyruvate isomerase